jgi:hypothetical protein
MEAVMTKYFFDFDGTTPHRDDLGAEFANPEVALREAILRAADPGTKVSYPGATRIRVRDDRGETIFEVPMSNTGNPVEGARRGEESVEERRSIAKADADLK